MARPINADVPRSRLPQSAATAQAAAQADPGGAEGDRRAVRPRRRLHRRRDSRREGRRRATGPETPAPVSEAPATSAEAPAAQTPDELGYPAFATANTTRVGGADPASNAAGVALATYPSTDAVPAAAGGHPGRRRGLARRDRRLGADGGAGRRPGPRLRSRTALPEPTEQALDALDPQGGKATKGDPGLRDRRGRGPFRACETTRVGARRRRRGRGGNRDAARRAARRGAAAHRGRAGRAARLRDAGRGLGGALGRSGPLRRARTSCRRRPRRR